MRIKINKNREKQDTEHYKGAIRSLQKQVRQLQRQLKYYDKRQHILEDNAEEIIEVIKKKDEPEPITKRIKCVSCKEGHYDEFHVLNRLYGTCDNCGLRKRLV